MSRQEDREMVSATSRESWQVLDTGFYGDVPGHCPGCGRLDDFEHAMLAMTWVPALGTWACARCREYYSQWQVRVHGAYTGAAVMPSCVKNLNAIAAGVKPDYSEPF